MRSLPREDDCTFVRERMELFLDGELTGSENLAFVTHLKECEECAASWADDEELATALLVAVGRQPAPAPVSFFSADGPRTSGGAGRSAKAGARLRVAPRLSASLVGFGAGVAAAVLLVWGVGGLASDRAEPRSPLAESASQTPAEPIASPRRLRVRRAGEQHWLPGTGELRLERGDEIWAADGPVALDCFPGRAIGLGQDAVATLRSGADESPVLDLHHGRIVADCDSRSLEVRVAEVGVEIVGAACVVEATLQAETLVVLRGAVGARLADGRHEEIRAGQAVEFGRDGEIRPLPLPERESELARLESVRRELAEAQERHRALRVELDRLRAENLGLRDRLEAASPVGDEISEARSIEYLVDRYLAIVDQANVASIERPAPIALETAARLTEAEGDVLGHLRTRIATDTVRLRKKALVGLVHLVARPGSRALLEELSFDPEPRVRESALYCLSTLPEAAPGLVDHFLRVARVEREDRVRLRAAVYAARRGADEGARIMAQLYATDETESEDRGLRAFIPMQMARLEGDLPTADRFLRCLLLDQASESRAMAAAIRGLVDRADFESVEVLRTFAERGDVGADLREMARDAIRKLEHHY